MRTANTRFGIRVGAAPTTDLGLAVAASPQGLTRLDGNAVGVPYNLETPAESSPTTLETLLYETGISNTLLAFSHELIWDPTTLTIFYLGGDHSGGPEEFTTYNMQTKVMQREPYPPFVTNFSEDNQNHSYSYQAFDPRGRYWYRWNEYDTGTEQWTEHPETGLHSSTSSRSKQNIAYMPGPGANAGVYMFYEGALYFRPEDQAAGSWQELYARASLGPADINGTSTMCLYNPFSDDLLFGGGSGASNKHYRLERDRTLTDLGSSWSPSGLFNCNGELGCMPIADPTTSRWIIFANNSGIWEYDHVANTFNELVADSGLYDATGTPGVNRCVAGYCSTYNCGIIWTHEPTVECQFWIYKFQ